MTPILPDLIRQLLAPPPPPKQEYNKYTTEKYKERKAAFIAQHGEEAWKKKSEVSRKNLTEKRRRQRLENSCDI